MRSKLSRCNRCDRLIVDGHIQEVFQFSLDYSVEAEYFFEKISVRDMFNTHQENYITKPRIDAKRDNCKWLFEFAKRVIMQHHNIIEKFATKINRKDIDKWIENNIVNIICMNHVEEKDGVDWHLDEEDTFAISIYDNGGIEFQNDKAEKIRHTTKNEIVASIGNTHIIEHRSIVGEQPRKVIVIFVKK